jgi:Arm DNA-binding domain
MATHALIHAGSTRGGPGEAVRGVRRVDTGARAGVTPTGHRSWALLYRQHGRLRRLMLGRYPDRTHAEARTAAIQERGRTLDGAEPVPEKHDERSGDTVRALFEPYKKASEKNRSWSEQRRIFEREVLPVWRHVRVQHVTRKDFRAPGPGQGANRADDVQPAAGADLAALQFCARSRLDYGQSSSSDQGAWRGTEP